MLGEIIKSKSAREEIYEKSCSRIVDSIKLSQNCESNFTGTPDSHANHRNLEDDILKDIALDRDSTAVGEIRSGDWCDSYIYSSMPSENSEQSRDHEYPTSQREIAANASRSIEIQLGQARAKRHDEFVRFPQYRKPYEQPQAIDNSIREKIDGNDVIDEQILLCAGNDNSNKVYSKNVTFRKQNSTVHPKTPSPHTTPSAHDSQFTHDSPPLLSLEAAKHQNRKATVHGRTAQY